MKIKPTNEQELFEYFIDQRRSVISEFYGREESWALVRWALKYAASRGLCAPTNPEAYGFYCALDDDEVEDLKQRGLWVEGLDWSKV